LSKDKLHLTEFSIELLELTAAYRYLTPELIALLLGRGSKQYVTRRLAVLQANGYLTQYSDDALALHWPDFYLHTDKAEDFLVEEGTEPHHIYRLHRKLDGFRAANFRHDFPAINVLASLEIEARKYGVTTKRWTDIFANAGPEPSFKVPCHVRYTREDGSVYDQEEFMVPDGLIGFKSAPQSVSYFTLELERGNPIKPTRDLHRASPLKKFIALKDIHRQAMWTDEERQLPSKQRPLRGYRKQLRISNLRTFFVAKSDASMNTMMNTAYEVLGPSNMVLFTHVDLNKPKPYDNLFTRQWHLANGDTTTLIKK